MEAFKTGEATALQKLGTTEFVLVCNPRKDAIPMTMSHSRGGCEPVAPDARFAEHHTVWYATWWMERVCTYGDGTADDNIIEACESADLPLPEWDTDVYMGTADVKIRHRTGVHLDSVMRDVIHTQARHFFPHC
jgi:hypothetical protein